jgi:hypothetical protein
MGRAAGVEMGECNLSDRKKVTFTQSKITAWVLTVDRALLTYATKIRREFYAFELPVF